MNKILIDVYAVTDQKVYDDDDNIKPLQDVFKSLEKHFQESYMKNLVELRLVDVLKDRYDEEKANENLSQGYLLPWVYFNGELEFYNGFSQSMIFEAAMKQLNYKIKRK